MRQIKNPPHKKWASQESTFGCIKVLQIEYGIIFVIASTATGTLGRTSSSLTSAWQSWLRWFWYCCSDGKYSLNSAHIMSAKFGRSRDAYACTNLRDFFLREICWEVGVICVNLLCKFCVQICCASFVCKFVVQFFWGDMCWEVWFVQIPPLPCHNCQKCSLLRICKLAQVCSPLCICHQQHLLCSFPTQSWTIQIMPSEMEVVRVSNWLGCNFKFLKFQISPRNWLPTHRPREIGKESGLRSLLLARYPCYWNCNPWYWISIVIVIGIVQVSTGLSNSVGFDEFAHREDYTFDADFDFERLYSDKCEENPTTRNLWMWNPLSCSINRLIYL